ncbi:hypothetical protein FHS59_004054 [Algoriphagus iocasae]|uniref:Uncharacterized protein n=1 Tax=Algoriphagus iocasae TaxID=1836499 RepID=A0A841N2L7_9BACT|nr:hypothetical protein [Algoriphagus iocasae]
MITKKVAIEIATFLNLKPNKLFNHFLANQVNPRI